jgi:hypothetical protein
MARDHSEEFQAGRGKSLRKRRYDVSPPNPVAGILFKSDAGKFFDELLDKFDQERSSAVQSREEFDRVVEMAYLRKGPVCSRCA